MGHFQVDEVEARKQGHEDNLKVVASLPAAKHNESAEVRKLKLDANDCNPAQGSSQQELLSPVSSLSASTLAISSINSSELEAKSLGNWRSSAHNPTTWSPSRKWFTTIMLSTFSFNTLMTSTMVIPALDQITKDLYIASTTRTQLVLSVYPLAYAVGFFVWAPLSEVYGRLPVLQIAGCWFVAWNLTCGFASSEAVIVAGRLFSGVGAAAALAISSGAVAEIWRREQRGRSLAIFSLTVLLGPSIGPIIGGSIASRAAEAWRWAFWSTSAFNAILQVVALVLLKESHAPTIIRRLERSQSCLEDRSDCALQRTSRLLTAALRRPILLLLTQPILQLLALYTGIAFGMLYLVLSTVTIAFQAVYGQTLFVASLSYLSFGIGMILGAQLCAPMIDWLYRRHNAIHRHGELDIEENNTPNEVIARTVSLTESRLMPMITCVLLVGTGALIYGWSLKVRTHWIGPNIGLMLFGLGNQAMTQCTNAYIIDAFSDVRARESSVGHSAEDRNISNISASAMCTIWGSKSLGGFLLPLAAPGMVQQLGWGWLGSVVAGCNVMVGIPVAILLLWRGKIWREKGKLLI